jgi:hypothetical protein
MSQRQEEREGKDRPMTQRLTAGKEEDNNGTKEMCRVITHSNNDMQMLSSDQAGMAATVATNVMPLIFCQKT